MKVHLCPSCGAPLEHNSDPAGDTFQCLNMSCLELFEADEIIDEEEASCSTS